MLTLTVVTATFLFFNLRLEGWGNTYYSAGVHSMLKSWSNFFFVAYDPSGFVTIDKPPLGFWLQGLSATLFGFSGVSLILPQALAGLVSVIWLYFIVRKRFGVVAATVAGFVLATTPIFVATARNNTIDTLLTLIFVGVSWAFVVAVEKRQVRYLFLAFVLVGLGFEVKMMEALLILPALGLGYLFTAPSPWARRVGSLAVGTGLLLVVALWWPTVVDLTPPYSRPFVGSTQHNSEWELIVGHNGFDRLGLSRSGPGEYRERPRASEAADALDFDNSRPGPLRFFDHSSLSIQVSWLLVVAALGAVGFGLGFFKRIERRRGSPLVVLWSIWFATEWLYFSFTAGMFHTYYLTTLAPALAALVAVGVSSAQQGTRWQSPVWFAGTLLVGLVVEGLLLSYGAVPGVGGLVGLMILAGGASVVLMLVPRGPGMGRTTGLILGIVALVAGPATLAAAPLFVPGNGSNPTATWKEANRGSPTNPETTDRLAAFLSKSQGSSSYALAVPSSRTYADGLILTYDLNVVPLGGFMGSDPVMPLEEFKSLVAAGEIPFALASSPTNDSSGKPGGQGSRGSGQGRFGFMSRANQELNEWIRSHGNLVPRDQWTPHQPGSPGPGFGSRVNVDLYDLRKSLPTEAAQ